MEPNSIQVLLLGLLVDETLILDSNCKQDSGLLELNHRFQIPEFQIPDSTDKNFLDFGIRIWLYIGRNHTR